MATRSRRATSQPPQPDSRRPLQNDIGFKQLVLIVREQWHVGATTDEIAWKERVEQRVHSLGFRWPKAGQVYAAMDAVKFVDRKRRDSSPPTYQGASGFSRIGSLSPKPPGNACGSSKPLSGRRPLQCTLARGHDGDHGMHAPSGELFVRWSQ